MHTPQIFISYAPRAGLRCAVACLSSRQDVYGWFVGQGAGRLESAYFLLQDFYSSFETRFLTARATDLHSRWGPNEARCHELAQLQDVFAREWLVGRDDLGAQSQWARYAEAELATSEVNVRFERLGRFNHEGPAWTYYSPHFEHVVLKFLARHWSLDFRLEAQPA